jgi:hypothetical protein
MNKNGIRAARPLYDWLSRSKNLLWMPKSIAFAADRLIAHVRSTDGRLGNRQPERRTAILGAVSTAGVWRLRSL